MSVLNSFSLKGKVAVVTGAAGLYGKQIARALAEAGAKTYAASRNIENLKTLADEFKKDNLDIAYGYLDQGDEVSVLNLKDEIIQKEGKVDILVNNAVLRTMKDWNDDASKFEKSMQVNATGVFMITRAFGDIMAKAGSGSIINIGSIQGMIGPDATLYEGLNFHSFVPDYFFHKGGIINFTRFVASYYGPRNVRCNCVSPGGFQTEQHPEIFVKRYSDRTFLGRMAQADDIKGIIVFLASDASQYITGANIPVDGGYTAK